MVCAIFIFMFLSNFASVCVSILELFPTLVIKILVTFQKNMHVKVVHSFFQAKVLFGSAKILKV